MREIEEFAEREHVPIVHWETGRFLATLVRATDPGLVLEVGTAIGYSTLHMAEALGSGKIVTIERDPERVRQATDFLTRGGVIDKVEIVEADAMQSIADPGRSTSSSSTRPRPSIRATSSWLSRKRPSAPCWWSTT